MNSYSYSASKYGICKGELQFYKIKHKKLSLISLKLTQKSLWYQKLLQHASHIKIKQMKLINMVSIKRKYSYYSLKCLPFVSKHLTNKTSKNYQIISQFGRKNILNRKLSKKQPRYVSRHKQHFFLESVLPTFTSIFKHTLRHGSIQWLTVNC